MPTLLNDIITQGYKVRYANIVAKIEEHIEENGLDFDDVWNTLSLTEEQPLKDYARTFYYLKDKLDSYADDNNIRRELLWDEVNQYIDDMVKGKKVIK